MNQVFEECSMISQKLVTQLEDWVEKRPKSANKLREIATKLDELRKDAASARVVGSGVAVLGGLGLVGSILFPPLAVATVPSAIAMTAGSVASGICHLVEMFASSSEMKDAKKIIDTDALTASVISNLVNQLKAALQNVTIEGIETVEEKLSYFIAGALALSVGVVGMHCFRAAYLTLRFPAAKSLAKGVQVIGTKTVFRTGMHALPLIGLAFDVWDLVDAALVLEKDGKTNASEQLRDAAKQIDESIKEIKDLLEQIRKPIRERAEVMNHLRKLSYTTPDNETYNEWAIGGLRYLPQSWQQQLQEAGQTHMFINNLKLLFAYLETELSDNDFKRVRKDIDFVFLAHGSIGKGWERAHEYAGSSIEDVVLYEPWNCGLSYDAAFGICLGAIQPEHRVWENCIHGPNPYPPLTWNSMKQVSSQIPRVVVDPVKITEPVMLGLIGLLSQTSRLNLNPTQKLRIVFPYIVPWPLHYFFHSVPFSLITKVISVLCHILFGGEVTIHLAACLGKEQHANFDVTSITQYSFVLPYSGESLPCMRCNPNSFYLGNIDQIYYRRFKEAMEAAGFVFKT